MAIMAVREFECTLCQQQFSRMCADFLLPEDLVCDECLAELAPLEGHKLRERIAQLAKNAPQPEPPRPEDEG